MRVELHPEVELELQEAVHYLDEIGGALSLEFAALVEETLWLLAAHPGIGAPVRSPAQAAGLRRHPMRKFNYLILYEPIPDGIFVYALAH